VRRYRADRESARRGAGGRPALLFL